MNPPSARADRLAVPVEPAGRHGRLDRAARRTTSYFRPRLEALEDRTLLANNLFRVPGLAGEVATFRFDWTLREARFNNEIGVFAVDAAGRVDGVAPGDPRYFRAAMRSASRQILFDSSTTQGNFRNLSFNGGTLLAFYIVQDGTSAKLLKTNPTNGLGGGKMAWFSTGAANADGRDHVRVSSSGTAMRFAWEDLTRLGDADFNDVVFDIRRVGPGAVNTNFSGRAIRTPGTIGQLVATTFTLLRREFTFTGEIGVFQVDNADGHIGALKPGDAGYAAAALSRSRRTSIFNSNQGTGATATFDLAAGSLFGVYVVHNGTADQAAAGRATALFSFLDANPNDADLMRQFQDSVFGFETGGDTDFRDVRVGFQFSTPRDPRETAAPRLTAGLQRDTGSSNTDRITSDPSILGLVSDPSGIRSLRAGLDNTAPAAFRDVTGTLRADGTFVFDAALMAILAGGTLGQGNRVLHLEVTDRVGNVARFDLAFTFDQTIPALAFDLTSDTDTDPDGDQVTQLATVTLRAVTEPGLTVRLEQTNQTAVADPAGIALFNNVALASGSNDFTMTTIDAAGNQATSRRVITRNDAPTVADDIADQTLNTATPTFTTALDAVFADANIVNSIARYNTNLGEFDVELFDASADGVTPRTGSTARTTPGHVANFIQYIDSTDNTRNYVDTIVHRVAKTANAGVNVVQGGGFKVNPNDFPTDLNEFGTVTNEPGNSNIRGTLALARSTGVNSGSSQWYINTTDNTSLDTNNEGFTVFGRVLGTGMNVVDTIAATPTFDVVGQFPTTNPIRGAFNTLPLQNTSSATEFPTAVSRNDYVVVNNVTMWQRMDKLTFEATTDQPTLVQIDQALLATGVLKLTRIGTPAQPTDVTITVTAKDSRNATVVDTFTVTVS